MKLNTTVRYLEIEKNPFGDIEISTPCFSFSNSSLGISCPRYNVRKCLEMAMSHLHSVENGVLFFTICPVCHVTFKRNKNAPKRVFECV